MDIYGYIMIACCWVFMTTRNPRVCMLIVAVFFTCISLSMYFGSFGPVDNQGLKISVTLFAVALWILNILRYVLSIISSSGNDTPCQHKGD